METDLKEITSRFLRHISSIERLLEQDINTIKRPSESDLGEFVSYVLYLKFKKLEMEIIGNEDTLNEVLEEIRELEQNEIFRVVDKNTNVSHSEEEYRYSISSSILRNAYNSYTTNKVDEDYDSIQYRNSLVVSMVIGLEILISNIFKNYINNLDTTNQIIKDKTLSFADLKNFESVEDARIYLQDQYIDNLLRSSFDGWLDEIESKIKIKVRKEEIIKDDIDVIIETLQRRHLIIHNDGIVNDFYIKKVNENLLKNVVKGEVLDLNNEYIVSRLKIIRKFGLVLIYQYASKIYKNDKSQFFRDFNNILLSMLHKDCDGVKYFYRKFSETQMEHSAVLMSKINYFLSYKLNNNPEIDDEIENFDISALSIDFRMAKSILLDKEDACDLAIQYFKTINDNMFISVLEWPLIKLLKHNTTSRRYIKRRMNSIIKKEMSENDD